MAITWALQATPNNGGSGEVNRLIWVPELALFVGVLSSGTNRVVTSPDGVTWTFRTASAVSAWRSLAWSPALSLLVAVASSKVMTSPDGITWTNRSISASSWRDVVWAPSLSLFVTVALSGEAATSPDGVTWTDRTTPAALQWNSVAWAPSLNLLVALAGNAAATSAVMTSPDGITWTQRSTPVSTTFCVTGIAWSPALGMFVACSTSLLTSTNGTTWANWSGVPSGWTGSNSQVVWAAALGLFLVTPGSTTSNILTSPDGVVWTVVDTAVSRFWAAIAAAPTAVVLCEQMGDSGGIEVALGLAASVTIDAVTPATGGTLGADPVTITGDGFVTGATVTFDGVAATDVVVVDAQTITCVIPAHAVGAVDVVVTNLDSSTGTLTDGFLYSDSATTPTVDAGQSQVATGPAPSTVTTTATVTRGLNNGTITYAWTQVSGPATATIATPTTLNTDLTFAAFVPGSYVFQLAATTEAPGGGFAGFTATSELTIVIAPTVAPRVSSGGAQVSA